MIRRLTMLASPLAVLAFNALAFAQEHGGEAAHAAHEPVGAIPDMKQGLYTGITALVVFLVVLIVLSIKVWPTIS